MYGGPLGMAVCGLTTKTVFVLHTHFAKTQTYKWIQTVSVLFKVTKYSYQIGNYNNHALDM